MFKTGFVTCAIGAAVVANAQVIYTGWELPEFNASASGVPVTGQNGWYIPVPGSADHKVYTYGGNALGFVQNPVGGNQFISGTSGGGTSFARAQFNVNFAANTYTIAYDVAALFTGTAPAAINLSSFSLQHDSVPAGQFKQYIALNNFVDNNNPAAGWKAEYNVFSAAGTAMNNQSPGAAWQNLKINHWYRQFTTVDLSSNQILSVGILDLHNGMFAFANPSGWYLTGGSGSTLALPNGLRFFVGGSAGNTMGWDNLSVVPGPGAASLLALSGLVALRRRR